MISARLRRASLAAALVAAAAGSASAGDDAAAPGGAAPPEIKREIRVRVACDEEWRAQSGWEPLARDYMARASAVFERRFGIRWRAIDVVPWKSQDDAETLEPLLHQLDREIPRDGVDVVFGFTGQTHAKGSTTPYPYDGQARYFGPVAIVGAWRTYAKAPWRRSSVVHELAHMLGAWHTAARETIMSSAGRANDDDERDPEFDAQSAAVIELCRDLDFSRGAAWLDDARRRRIDEIFRAGHAPDASLPYVNAELSVAPESDPRATRDVYGRALAATEACVGPKDALVAEYLAELARAWMDGPDADFALAERFARRACDVAASLRDPKAARGCDEVLAFAVWKQGRRDEALELYRRVYVARLAAGGPTDPHLKKLKSWLDDYGGTIPRRRWSDVGRTMTAASPVEPGAAFGSPKPGTLHVRPAPAAPTPPTRVDEDVRWFEVAVPSSGRLTIALVQSGGSAPPRAFRATAQIPAGFDPAHPTVVGLSYRSIDEAGDGPLVQYVCRLFVQSPAKAAERFFGADAPADASACVGTEFDFSGRAFVALGQSAALVFRRCWSDAPVGSAPDGEGAKRTWRLELTFAPDAPK